MPKHIRDSDYGRFRIVPEGNRYFVQEKIEGFMGLWERWKTLQWNNYNAFDKYYFSSIDQAKQFIDNRIALDNSAKVKKDQGIIYYP